MYIQRKWRLLRGRCPYCNKRLLKGMGGMSLLSLSGMKVCPQKHYAEEQHITGATLIYDHGGKPLDIKGVTEFPEGFRELENDIIAKALKDKCIEYATINSTSVEIKFSDDTYLDIKMDHDKCEMVTSFDSK